MRRSSLVESAGQQGSTAVTADAQPPLIAHVGKSSRSQRPRPRHPEILARMVRIESTRLTIGIRAEKRLAAHDASSYLELIGTADEPLKGIDKFSVQLSPEDPEPMTSASAVGALSASRGVTRGTVFLPKALFDRAWMLASSGRLTHCRLAFTVPHYGSALIVSAYLSSDGNDVTYD